MKNLRLSARAHVDLNGVQRFTVQRWGQAQAERYGDKLTSAMMRLIRFPELGAVYSNPGSGLRRMLVGKHFVFYRITGEDVIVVRVLHERMNAKRRLGVKL